MQTNCCHPLKQNLPNRILFVLFLLFQNYTYNNMPCKRINEHPFYGYGERHTVNDEKTRHHQQQQKSNPNVQIWRVEKVSGRQLLKTFPDISDLKQFFKYPCSKNTLLFCRIHSGWRIKCWNRVEKQFSKIAPSCVLSIIKLKWIFLGHVYMILWRKSLLAHFVMLFCKSQLMRNSLKWRCEVSKFEWSCQVWNCLSTLS